MQPTTLLGDNQGAIALAKNPGDHPRTKHIQLRYHFIRFALADGQINLGLRTGRFTGTAVKLRP